MLLSAGRILNLASAICGIAGTAALYKGSFAYEQPAMWGSDEGNKAMYARNRKRQIFQRAGLGLICLSFCLQGVAQFLD